MGYVTPAPVRHMLSPPSANFGPVMSTRTHVRADPYGTDLDADMVAATLAVEDAKNDVAIAAPLQHGEVD
eukprot:4180806-Karenia_brevis.AAC.1